MQVIEMKTKLEERIKGLEEEKAMLLEEVRQLKEVVALSEKAKALESEVDRLKEEAKTLKRKVPPEFLEELGEFVSSIVNEDEQEETSEEECVGCEEEELL